jgi:tetratricopeptide (TPR) repeat protein
METDLSNAGDVFLAMGRLADAGAAYRQARVIAESRLPESNLERFEPLKGLASVALARGDIDEAISKFEQVLRGWEKAGALAIHLAEVQFNLAIALDRGHRDPVRAHDLARAAVASFATLPAFDAQRREVQAWLDKREQSRWRAGWSR